MCDRCFHTYVWVKSSKDKKAKTVLHGFTEIVNESNPKPSRLWLIKEEYFTIALCKKRVDDNDIIMYSTHNEGKSVVAESFIITLTDKV